MSALEEIVLRQSLLWAGIITGLGFATIYAAAFCYRDPSLIKTVIKAGLLTAFIIAGIAGFANPIVLLALVMALLGDIALSRDGDAMFLNGLIAFALTHALYIYVFCTLISAAPIAPSAIFALGALCLFAASSERWLIPHVGTLKWPVRLYIFLLTAMGTAALLLPADYRLATLGALALILSDLVLGLQRFRLRQSAPRQMIASLSIWTLYAIGQTLIFTGVGFAQPLFLIP